MLGIVALCIFGMAVISGRFCPEFGGRLFCHETTI
ncbi:hypothetical protein J2128_002177 [Methanomicrobium sp. W14]|nr:hypothetical protein [Methanomicrobium sp. W14]